MRKVTLSFKLLLLIAFPLLLALAAGVYALRKFQADLPVVTSLILIVIYIPLAVAFIRRLGKNIRTIETVTADLANGKLNGKVTTANLPEARNISESINLVMDDLHRKAAFAEQIKSGNLDVPFTARHENDPL